MSCEIILVGDCILNKQLPDDNALLKIFNNADLCIGNFESLIHNFEFYPEKYDGQGTPMQTPPKITSLLNRYNLKMVGHANNHSNDYGPEALINSINYLEKSNIEVAGVGENEHKANKPKYRKINNYTIGFVATTSTYSKWAVATPEIPGKVKGRPGVNNIKLKPNFLLYLSKGLKILLNKLDVSSNKLLKFFTFGDYNINKKEYQKIRKQIEEGKSNSDILIYSLHSHQRHPDRPAKALRKLAKFCINSGADVFFSHGTHELRGIEIYQNKPIFYGLGNFFAQSQEIKYFPADFIISKGFNLDTPLEIIRNAVSKVILKKPQWWYSIAARIKFNNKNYIKEIEIIPVDLSIKQKIGWPHLAEDDKFKTISKRIKKTSNRFKTNIEERDGKLKILFINNEKNFKKQ
ncbi:MAG: CapA family protein [bacterium]